MAWHRLQQRELPSAEAQITKFYVAQPAQGSGYETGAVHIGYSDGTELVEPLSPLRKSTKQEQVFNTVGFDELQLADDRQTLGWAVMVENCCTSYSIALGVSVFRGGKVIRTITPGQMVWEWMFLEGGKQVGIISGPTHGANAGDYKLYSSDTGKLISEVPGDEESGTAGPDAPEWAKLLDQRWHRPR